MLNLIKVVQWILICIITSDVCMGKVEENSILIGQKTEIKSIILNETRTLYISLPRNYEDSQECYPVVFVLDAGMNFPVTATMIRYLSVYRTIPKMIVIGIENISQATRNRDFTSTSAKGGAAQRYPTAGGADSFLQFIKDELIPYVDTNYRTHPYRILIGHSLGGLFIGHALINEPELFGALLSISPSFWWNDFEPIDQLKLFMEKQSNINTHLIVTLADEGDAEDILMLQNLCVFMADKGGADFNCTFKHFPDQNHASTVIPSTLHGLQLIYSDWSLPWEVIKSGLRAVKAHYENLTHRFGYDIPLTKQVLHHAACSALVGGYSDIAIEMLEYNRERYPEYTATYSILSEAWEEKDHLQKALKFAQKALDKDPSSEKYQRRVQQLKEKQ
ncbi:alpha/beta hydrolase [bacterium]|nr:alpha/beta hydrolase [bacterium]